ncbi:flagellar biosynthesis protein FlhB [Piscinibacter sakaiensis]|uniref:Flagellar biosynthetic protein FlhB n=1 Tax=Piscinibacter sakaiensis TaxID=1547922 RepID=A0A0K8P542_PISS1|nr:flagellar biosynthesis protein FlhB [Piscinibacter sakaiensis]GAP37315.1 flagellar biosynthesis protein FlhB [Piscinibacter sakaiensis]
MADSSSEDRNLPATPRKINKAREEGNVPRSQDLGHFAALAVGGSVLVATAPQWVGWMRELLSQALRFDHRAVASPAFMGERLLELTLKLLVVILPLGVLMAVVALGASLAVGGWNFTLKAMQPRFEKFNPITGLPRIFAKQQLINALKAVVLALILGTVGALYLRAHVDSFVGTLGLALPAALGQVGDTVLGGLLLLLLVLALFAVVDAPLQRHLHLSRLKMSHQEVKKEHKETEGSAEVKGRIRSKMREMSRRRMMAAVPTADLVVMNPTHYAVALKYDEASMGAPRVVAKGTDRVALAIRDLAKTSKVPVLQAPVLARALYAHAQIDREIPAALFSAVAQVLAYVYQLRAAAAGRGRGPGDLPALDVPPELDPHHRKTADPETAE